MTQYRDIGVDLAQRVRTGELSPGSELPTVREAAAEFSTTSTTITRAYRYLADGGVITIADRRRARVATGGALAAARLLEVDRVFRLAGSDDPALHLLIDHTGPSVSSVGTRGSFWALRMLSRGQADGAAIHLRDRNGDYNAPYARTLLAGQAPHLIRLWRREQGLLVPPGNPHRIREITDIERRTVARRETGAGTRVLLDQLALAAGLTPESIAGPELRSHLEAGLAVAAGIADVALGLRTAARELALDFVPLLWESYDLVLPAAALPAARPFLVALADTALHARITALGGYDLTGSGRVDDLDLISPV